jgi:AcrR family transcriptional regulator
MDLVTEQKLERRERILEAARNLIAERGYEGITMRELAVHCRVSVPTLYNQFESKDGLLATAVESHLVDLLNLGEPDAGWQGHQRMVGMVERCSAEMARLSGYHRALLTTFMTRPDTARLQGRLTGDLAREIRHALEQMSEDGTLARWVEPAILARRITAAIAGASLAWSLGELDDDLLAAAMLHAAASMTLGAASGDARDALEADTRQAQQVFMNASARPDAKERAVEG